VLRLVREAAQERGGELARSGSADPFLWLRQVTGQVLARLHHERLGPDVRGDVSLFRGALPEATTVSLAAHLLGKDGGDDDKAAARADQKIVLQEALNAMSPLDREILTLRHCEQLSNDQVAVVLGIGVSEASEGYIRALKRITPVLASLAAIKKI
jgi:RNA polymerase sigma-70 factor, ECF subfamily